MDITSEIQSITLTSLEPNMPTVPEFQKKTITEDVDYCAVVGFKFVYSMNTFEIVNFI